MRKSRFTESQIVAILKQGEAGVPIAEILRQHNISKRRTFSGDLSTPGPRSTS
jgi:hypothetical protein